MKNRYLGLLCAGLLLGGSTEGLAQVNLSGISVGASYWRPSLDYWNKRSLLTDYNNGRGAMLGGQVMPNVGLEIGLLKGLTVGPRAGYWKSSAASDLSIGGNSRSEKLTVSIIPVSLEVKYRFGAPPVSSTMPTEATTDPSAKPKTPFVIPYLGVGLSRYFINNAFRREITNPSSVMNESQSGNNYGVQVFAGVERKIVKKLYAAIDVRYHLGNYNQLVQAEAGTSTEKVSLNGLEAGLSLRFKLAD